jgi:transaldolase
MAGCNYVAPYVNRMLDNNIDPFEQIHQMYQIFKMQQLPCKVMAASFKNAHQVLKAMGSGALTATITYDVFEKMVNKNLTISALQVFNTHGKELDLRCL